MRKVYQEYGSRIQGFARAGLYRHAGGADNVIYSVERKQLLMIDLDSSRDLADVPQPNQGLEVLRDVASIMYRFLGGICRPSRTNPLPVEEIMENDPLGAVIAGFFGPESGEATNELAKALWLAYLPHHFVIERNSEPILTEYAQHSLHTWQRLMIEPDLFYILAILLLYRLYSQSDLAMRWPCGIRYDELLRKAERCLGDRFRYLTSLLSVGQHYS